MRNLNSIFKTNNRQAQRKILDKFDISKEDKNKTLNELANVMRGESSDNVIYYKVLNSLAMGQFGEFLKDCYLNVIPYNTNSELTKSVIVLGGVHPMFKNGCKINYISFIPFETEGIKINTFEYLLELFGLKPEEIVQVVERTTREEFYKLDNE
jgi:hypothetical protein